MFNAKARRIAELEARTAMLRRKLDATREGNQASAPKLPVPEWEPVAKQVARDRIQADRAAKAEIARLNDIISGWAELSAAGTRRLHRLARGAARYRRTIAEQTATIAELRERLDRWEGGDRAVRGVPPIDADTKAQINSLKSEVGRLQSLLNRFEEDRQRQRDIAEALDWKRPIRVAS